MKPSMRRGWPADTRSVRDEGHDRREYLCTGLGVGEPPHHRRGWRDRRAVRVWRDVRPGPVRRSRRHRGRAGGNGHRPAALRRRRPDVPAPAVVTSPGLDERAIAAQLIDAYDRVRPITPITRDHSSFDVAAAYRVLAA